MSYNNDDDNSEYRGFDRNYDGDFKQKTHAMPIKPHIKQIEDFIAEIRKDTDDNKKVASILKGDLNVLGHKTKEKCNELTKLIMEDLHNLEKEFKRTVQSDKTEINFFKQQLHGLEQDKTKIKHSSITLDSKLKQCEGDVGMGFMG